MKKLICLVCAVALMLVLGSCGKAEPSVYDHGLETVALMAQAISSEDYLNLMTAAEPLRSVIADAAQGDYTTPKAALSLTFPGDGLLAFSGQTEPIAVPDSLSELVSQRLISAVVPRINAMGGAETLAAATVCTVSRTFVSPSIDEDAIYLYLFEAGCPVAVTFTTGGDNTVTATAVPILYADFPQNDMDAMQELFGGAVEIALLSK